MLCETTRCWRSGLVLAPSTRFNNACFFWNICSYSAIHCDLRFGEILLYIRQIREKNSYCESGPGNGWRATSAVGKPRSMPNCLTSSLWNYFNGSITWPSARNSCTSSLSLWCVFMALPLTKALALSITSGLRVPCPRKIISGFQTHFGHCLVCDFNEIISYNFSFFLWISSFA